VTKTPSIWGPLPSRTYCRCSSPTSTRPPRPDPSCRFTRSRRSHGQSTSVARPPRLSHGSCRKTASRSRTQSGALRCSRMENRQRPSFQHFGRTRSWRLLLAYPTRFSQRCLTSWNISLHRRMRKVRCRKTSRISRIFWKSGNLSKFPNIPSHWWLGMTCQPRNSDRESTFTCSVSCVFDDPIRPQSRNGN